VSFDVGVIGGGVIGCAIAYNLAKFGQKNVVVFERQYPGAGSTGRCGAGVRQQWGLEMNCRLARGSVKIFEQLSSELGVDIEFRQGGYLVLAHTEKQIEQFEKNVSLQNSLGIPSRIITVEEALEIVPYLNPESFIAATFCPTDGHANPLLTNYAYAKAAERLGVKVMKFTEVSGVERSNGVFKLTTSRGDFEVGCLVNAAGGYSKPVAAMVGVDIPTYSERHQILVTAPVPRMFDCMVISFTSGIYAQQVPQGSFVLGIAENEEPSYNTNSSWQFLEHITYEVTSILPVFGELSIVRQWAGLYNKTPDSQPILGEVSPGFFVAVGFSGHGFMIAPKTAEIMAKLILGIKPDIDISYLSLDRFEKGELIVEPSVVG